MSGYDGPPPGPWPPPQPAQQPPQQVAQQPAAPGYPAYPPMYTPTPAYPPLTEPPLQEAEYHEIHRTHRPEWWRPLVGVLVVVVAFVVAQILLTVFFAVGLFASGMDGEAALETLTGQSEATPVFLAFLFASLASLIPITMGVMRLIHGLGPGWLVSVTGRFRWRWLAVCFALSAAALVLTIVVALFLPAGTEGGEVGGELNEWTSTLRDFLLVVVLLTPLQAAGEEYAFRGYLTQGLGGVFSRINPWTGRAVAVIVPAALFALAHGAQDAPIFVDRLAFGLVAGVLVIVTGGLEAGIAMHVLNNYLAFAFALAFGDMSSALQPSGGTWWQLPQTLTQSLSYLALAIWAARRLGVATRTAPRTPVATPAPSGPGTPSGLEASGGRV